MAKCGIGAWYQLSIIGELCGLAIWHVVIQWLTTIVYYAILSSCIYLVIWRPLIIGELHHHNKFWPYNKVISKVTLSSLPYLLSFHPLSPLSVVSAK